MEKIAILTSGGDAPGMNACIRAAVRSALYYDMEIVGVLRGYEGLIDGNFVDMDLRSVGDILHRGGTILRTARSERFRTEEGISRAISNLEKEGIEGLIACGGDGTFRGAADLARRGVAVACVPGTIDNDMGYTDYTIGFDTAVNTVLDAISLLRDTSSAHERTTLIEVMGRKCGDIALNAGLAGGADAILIPELDFRIDEVAEKLKEGIRRGKKHSIIIKAEGVPVPAKELSEILSEKTGMEIKYVVLAYLQRGGSPTANDRIRAALMAREATKCLYEDVAGIAVGVKGDEVFTMPIEEAVAMKREPNLELLPLIDMLSR